MGTKEIFSQTTILEKRLEREGLRRLNVSGVLRILGVSRSGYNSFKEREFNMPAKLTHKEKLKNLILDIHLWSKQILATDSNAG
jgi:putative transposase